MMAWAVGLQRINIFWTWITNDTHGSCSQRCAHWFLNTNRTNRTNIFLYMDLTDHTDLVRSVALTGFCTRIARIKRIFYTKLATAKLFGLFGLLLPFGQWAYGESRVQKNSNMWFIGWTRITWIKRIFVFKKLPACNLLYCGRAVMF